MTIKDPALYEKTFYAAHPDMMDGASNEDLRDRHIVTGLFRPGEIVLTYSHGERFVIGGAVPGRRTLRLPDQTEPESAAGLPLLERRELGVVNIGGGEGLVQVDGQPVRLAKYEALYVPMGSREVSFSGDGARFYLLSVPAHAAFPLRKITAADIEPLKRGSLEASNERTIYQLSLPHTCQSASLCLGLTRLEPGSVWDAAVRGGAVMEFVGVVRAARSGDGKMIPFVEAVWARSATP